MAIPNPKPFGRGFSPYDKKRIRIRLLRCFLILMLSWITSCAPFHAPPQPSKPVSASQVLGLVQRRFETWHTYQGVVRVVVFKDGKASGTLRVLVVSDLPDRCRMEARTTFGTLLSLIVVRPEASELWLLRDNMILRAQNSSLLTKLVLGIPVNLKRVALLVAGCVPQRDLQHQAIFSEMSSPAILQLPMLINGRKRGQWILGLDPPTFIGFSLRTEGGDLVQGKYEPPVSLVDPRQPPRFITIEGPAWKIRLTVERLQVRSTLSPSLFSMPRLPGVRSRDVGEVTP